MVDFAIVLIGLSCFASVLCGRHVFLGTAWRTVEGASGFDALLRRRQFTRFMHINLTVAGTVIAILLLSQGADPMLSVSADPVELLPLN